MSDKYERFVSSYLRLNGYFTIPNFIVHAASDPNRVMHGSVGNYTETDLLTIRMPYSVEQTANLCIANDSVLVNGAAGKFDVVIAEVKSGANNKPNTVWCQNENSYPVEYLVRFVGLFSDDSKIKQIARGLIKEYRSDTETCRFRYVVFASAPNKHYQNRGVQYITFGEMAKFLVEIRGQSWINSKLGVASSHPQWDPLLARIFEIANDYKCSVNERANRVISFLSEA